MGDNNENQKEKKSEVGTTTWWEKTSIQYAFSHPQIRSRLEKLMGSNTVSLTDRKYMQRLQERILEDYAESMDKRIRIREVEELERVKNLVLNGRIPLSQAPPEMAQHPVMLIEDFCNRLIAERRAKIKIPQVKIPTYLYWDDTPDPESGLSIEKGHIFRGQDNRLCVPIEKYLEADEDTDIKRGYMLTKEEFETIKYENPLVKQLMTCETVEEMYALADEIIGVLKTIDESAKTYEDVATEAVENV
ncbi:uncharacterized protein isoform X2 [Leptinotarsa decemlineata]|uniref:uncharacterized protein isoform X2 n=1 Tax=Leptinotarsa decemlineata TaxID=7539 RepID=UPI003D30C631